jgi:hypothetical protein
VLNDVVAKNGNEDGLVGRICQRTPERAIISYVAGSIQRMEKFVTLSMKLACRGVEVGGAGVGGADRAPPLACDGVCKSQR